MSDYTKLFERAGARYEPPDLRMEELLMRQDHKRRNQRIRAGMLGLAIAIAVGWLGFNVIPPTPLEWTSSWGARITAAGPSGSGQGCSASRSRALWAGWVSTRSDPRRRSPRIPRRRRRSELARSSPPRTPGWQGKSSRRSHTAQGGH